MELKKISVTALAATAVASIAGLGYAAPPHATPAATEYQSNKVQVCHNGHTITISRSALKGHLRHHDTLGPCPRSKHNKGKHKGQGK